MSSTMTATRQSTNAAQNEIVPACYTLENNIPPEPDSQPVALPEQLNIEESIQTELPQYPKGIQLYMLLIGSGLVLMLTALDQQILATAIPTITDGFKSVADIGWYASAYRLSLCSFQFMFGKLYRMYPLKTMFMLSLLIFEIGSAICGAAPASAVFIVGRTVAGVGASGIFAGCFRLVTVCFPLRRRPFVIGVLGATESIASLCGPTLGGLITQGIGWRWCFYINLPLGGATLLLFAFFLNPPKNRSSHAHLPWKQKLAQMDILGTVVFLPALSCLFVALQDGASKYGWSDGRVVALFAVSGALLAGFGYIQYRQGDDATLPIRIIRQRSIITGFVFSFCTSAALNVVSYYLPTYMQAVKGMSPSKSGILVMPLEAGFMLSMLFAGSAVSIIGFYVPFMLAASIMMPIASGLLTTLRVGGPIASLIGYEVLLGIGSGLGFQAPQSAAQTSLPEADASMGLNIIVFAQNFGPALLLNVAQSLFSQRLVANLSKYVPGLNGASLGSLGLTDIKNLVPASELEDALLGYDKAITQTFYVSLVLTCVTIFGSLGMEWRSVKEKRH